MMLSKLSHKNFKLTNLERNRCLLEFSCGGGGEANLFTVKDRRGKAKLYFVVGWLVFLKKCDCPALSQLS